MATAEASSSTIPRIGPAARAGEVGHGADIAVGPEPLTVDEPGRLYEFDKGVRVCFRANSHEELLVQIRALLRKLGTEKRLSDVRRNSANVAATMLGTICSHLRAYADWARNLGDVGVENAPTKQYVSLFGMPDDVRVTLGDLLLLPKRAREALWLTLLAREINTPDDTDPTRMTDDARKASAEATDTDFDTLFDGVVDLDEAKRLEAIHTTAGTGHLRIAAWARRVLASGVPVQFRRISA